MGMQCKAQTANDVLKAGGANFQAGGLKTTKVVKETGRARDRVLRDKEVGRQVLELRKAGAFLGYTYRRPHGAAVDQGVDGFERPGPPGRGRLPAE